MFDNKTIDMVPFRVELSDERYPERVKLSMGANAPIHLDMIGNLELLTMPGIGFCGSRKSSTKGLEITQDCAEQAARNDSVVVSGNATGIDFAAHFNSLKVGGKTILILPEGINHFRVRKAFTQLVWNWELHLSMISQY